MYLKQNRNSFCNFIESSLTCCCRRQTVLERERERWVAGNISKTLQLQVAKHFRNSGRRQTVGACRVPCSKCQILTGRVHKHTATEVKPGDTTTTASNDNNENKQNDNGNNVVDTSFKNCQPCKFCMRKHLTPFSLKQCKQRGTQLNSKA